jgi:hypothetical protein
VVGLRWGVEDSSGREERPGDGKAFRRRRPRAADGHGGVETHRLVQDAVEKGDGIKIRHDKLVRQCLAIEGSKLFEESLSEASVAGEVVEDEA